MYSYIFLGGVVGYLIGMNVFGIFFLFLVRAYMYALCVHLTR